MHTVMFPLIFILSLFSRLCFAENYSDTNQILMQSPDDSGPKVGSAAMTTPKIAIIGAGITGASLAHHLHQLARLRQPLDITVFEADGQVGGRVRSAYVHNEPAFGVEVGAATFKEDDWCLINATQESGLKPVVRSRSGYRTAVWGGNELLVSYSERDKPVSGPRWPSAEWAWRYGNS